MTKSEPVSLSGDSASTNGYAAGLFVIRHHRTSMQHQQTVMENHKTVMLNHQIVIPDHHLVMVHHHLVIMGIYKSARQECPL